MTYIKNNKLSSALIIFIISTAAVLEWLQGRLLVCACGRVDLWAGDIWSSDNSQHIFDPYSFTHVLHGFLFLWILLVIAPRLKENWQMTLAVLAESTWEVVENSKFIIDRYRESTLALGYQGDTVVNSVSDILVCAAGVLLARYLGVRKSIAVFVIVEMILLIWIRDNLTLNIIMLIHPIDSIKQWQMGK
jgi:hypothetical protein